MEKLTKESSDKYNDGRKSECENSLCSCIRKNMFAIKLQNPNVPLRGSKGVETEDLRSIRGEEPV